MPVTENWAYWTTPPWLRCPPRTGYRPRVVPGGRAGKGMWLGRGWADRVEAVRARCARLIHADPDEIAFVHNTTAGISLVAEGLAWEAGDNLVTLANEFPSNLYPWLNLGRAGRGDAAGAVADGLSSRTQSWLGATIGRG